MNLQIFWQASNAVFIVLIILLLWFVLDLALEQPSPAVVDNQNTDVAISSVSALRYA